METWMIHALLASLFTGLFGIFQKIESEDKTINRDSFIFYAYLFGSIFSWIIFLFLDISLIFNIPAILAGVFVTMLYIYVLKLRHNCLEYMTSSSYFINYRIFSSIGLVIVWAGFLWEHISINEYLGIVLWFIIFYLLLEKKHKKENTTDLQKGYVFLGISIILSVFIWVVQKYFTITADAVWIFLFSSSVAGTIWALITSKNFNIKKTLTIPNKKMLWFLLLVWFTFGPGYIFHLYAIYSGWDIAIIYKIISYSLFLPIIFSIIYYKEPLTPKKIIAFILTILSIGLFI